ncbi:MAG: hypothetical protein A3F11_00185 [Gammaproteobacteria bacterium RIFCSPHIGHO2_12_FULL_37_14]|nr:MAG: hypothetical protein A3F11_00185 [Gammaproteobacteria bacterium RIFCSPHIGHO2_12_FULL_37_14]
MMGMGFFKREVTNLTIDEINLDKITDFSPLNFPIILIDCIANAVGKRQYSEIKKIHDAILNHRSKKVSIDFVIDQFYFNAIATSNSYKPDELATLLSIIPIDINKPICHVYSGPCMPPVMKHDSLLKLAIKYHQVDLVKCLVENNADLQQGFHEGETATQELEKRIAESKRENNMMNDLETLESMLSIVQSKMKSQSLRF